MKTATSERAGRTNSQLYRAQRLPGDFALPQFGNTACRDGRTSKRPEHRNCDKSLNTVKRECGNTATIDSNTATMTHDHIREITDWRINALWQSGKPDLPESDNA